MEKNSSNIETCTTKEDSKNKSKACSALLLLILFGLLIAGKYHSIQIDNEKKNEMLRDREILRSMYANQKAMEQQLTKILEVIGK